MLCNPFDGYVKFVDIGWKCIQTEMREVDTRNRLESANMGGGGRETEESGTRLQGVPCLFTARTK